ncbi:MAG: UDP-N-acetyl-D-mannosamine dehydrogenase [Legionella sp.]|nr:UDP-N-acetyl-D-mannosamine dehydrogenase [Legionella sp.]
MQKIAVIGLGYIGLPTAALIASRAFEVVGVDINAKVVETVNRGKIPIIEPGLDELVQEVVNEGYLRAALVPESADVFVMAVPTPFKQGHEPDLSYLETASASMAPFLKKGDLVIVESTSPVGTTAHIAALLAQARMDLTFPHTHGENADIHVAYCPERVLPGRVLIELAHNDRIIGGMTLGCSQKAAEFYRIFMTGDCILTDANTAEMCKLTENSFRDVNIAFANELSMICHDLRLDVWELIQLANRHPRVNILNPGPGVGGHCIAVDPWFIVHQAPEKAHLIRTAREVNEGKAKWVLQQTKLALADFLQAHPKKTLREVSIACFGLSFKPNIDDLRESPALKIVEEIAQFHSGEIYVVEPHVSILPPLLSSNTLGNCTLVDNQTAIQADILIMLVNHTAFQGLRPATDAIIVDTQGVWSKKAAKVIGVEFETKKVAEEACAFT